MTKPDEFNIKPCNKIDPECINAFVDFHLDPNNATGLCLETSWGGDCLDLTSIVKAGETVTHLHLGPEENPNCLIFDREDGESDCIHGDDLSRIISMQYLKDVDQTTGPTNGDIYIYRDGKFYTFNLQAYMDDVANRFSQLWASLNTILARYQIPDGLPSDAKIAFSNINLYSDKNAAINSSGTVTSLDKSSGIYGHSLNTNRDEDEIFG